jgi:hypothetical protein
MCTAGETRVAVCGMCVHGVCVVEGVCICGMYVVGGVDGWMCCVCGM